MNYIEIEKSSPIIEAVRRGDTRQIDSLLKQGFNLLNLPLEISNFQCSDFCKLVVAIQQGDESEVSARIQTMRFTVNVGYQLLRLAVSIGKVGVVRLLLQHGCKTDVSHSLPDELPMVMAMNDGKSEIVMLLLEHCKHKSPSYDALTSSLLDFGYSLSKLKNAIFHGRKTEIIRLLPSICLTEEVGNEMLSLAVHCNNVGIAEILINIGCKVNIDGCDASHLLHDALSKGNIEMLDLLIRNGADLIEFVKKNTQTFDFFASELSAFIFHILNGDFSKAFNFHRIGSLPSALKSQIIDLCRMYNRKRILDCILSL